MKLFIKLLIFIVVLGVSGLFVLKRPDGQPWLDIRAFIPDFKREAAALDGVKQAVVEQFNEVRPKPESTVVTVYKWRNAEGQWTYSDTPPENAESEIIVVNSNTNIVQSEPLPSPKVEQKSGGNVTVLSEHEPDDESSSLLKGGLGNVLQDANNVQKLLDQRKLDQDRLSNN